MNDQDTDIDSLLTAQEVAQCLQVPVSWVYRHSRRSARPRLPCLKLGKYLRFRPKDIEEFLGRAKGNDVAHETKWQ